MLWKLQHKIYSINQNPSLQQLDTDAHHQTLYTLIHWNLHILTFWPKTQLVYFLRPKMHQ